MIDLGLTSTPGTCWNSRNADQRPMLRWAGNSSLLAASADAGTSGRPERTSMIASANAVRAAQDPKEPTPIVLGHKDVTATMIYTRPGPSRRPQGPQPVGRAMSRVIPALARVPTYGVRPRKPSIARPGKNFENSFGLNDFAVSAGGVPHASLARNRALRRPLSEALRMSNSC